MSFFDFWETLPLLWQALLLALPGVLLCLLLLGIWE
jgi:hypothetical protein